ncbi:MAG: FAD-linked oxidase C-terminal domain-containing protein, partial [Hydrogenobaculum sp.]
GIVSKAILKLIPKPPYKSTIMGIFNNIENIGKSVTKILTSGILPCALEFMDKNSIQAVQKFYPAGIPEDAEGVLLIELDGQKESVEKEKMEVSNILKFLGANVIPAQNPQHEQKLWSARKNIGPALANIKSGKINEDIVFPRIYLSEALQKINEIAKKYNLTIVNFGHIGDGNLHVNILYDKLNKEELERAEKAVDEVFELALHYQGSITGEHGVGLTKKKFLEWQLKDAGIELLKAIKQSFDPKNLFNPGKVI